MYELLDFNVRDDHTGKLVALEKGEEFPFEIKRVYYIWDTDKDIIRGKHAHKALEQVIICSSGSCDFILDNGKKRETVHLDNPAQGLHIKHNIWQFCVVLKEAQIGDNCNICSHCFIENDVVIGNNVTIKCGVQIWDGMRIEDNVFIGPNVTFCNDKYPKSRAKNWKNEPVIIKHGAMIGANVTILPGIVIGENAIIGAGAVVTKDVVGNQKVIGKH